MKTCSKCRVQKDFEYFYFKGNGTPTSYCKECNKKQAKKWRQENKERFQEYTRKSSNRVQKWAEENREKVREHKRNWKERNKDYSVYSCAKRRARKKNAIPAWSNNGCVLMFYRERDWISKVTNLEYHVDHVVPLLGNNVCGLHVETNLRIIPAVENLVKFNKLPEEL